MSIMAAEQTFLCETCSAKRHRPYSVPYFLYRCANGCGFRRFVRSDIIESLSTFPENARPENWDSLSLQQKLVVAGNAASPK
jgi:hypothetical protein